MGPYLNLGQIDHNLLNHIFDDVICKPPTDYRVQFCVLFKSVYYWEFNYDAPGQTLFFSPEPFRVLLSDIIFPSVLTSHSASNSRTSEVSKIVLTFFMILEERWTADENILFFSKQSIVIKLPVTWA